MSEPDSPTRGFRVHPLDLLVLVMAIGLGTLAYAYLFKSSPVPRVVDRFLGAEIEVEFEIDRDWKKEFPQVGESAEIEDYLVTDVVERKEQQWEDRARARVLLRVKDRHGQRPETMTLFRSRIRRGIRVRIAQDGSEVEAEVISVRMAEEGGDGGE